MSNIKLGQRFIKIDKRKLKTIDKMIREGKIRYVKPTFYPSDFIEFKEDKK